MSKQDKQAPAKKADAKKQAAPLGSEALDLPGLSTLVEAGLTAKQEFRTKNRIILLLLVALIASVILNFRYTSDNTVIRLLGETTDGRIRPLPLLSDPIYTNPEILEWSSRCVRDIYSLSYVDWEVNLRNNTQCLADGAQREFARSLESMGLLENLSPANQGILYAIPGRPIIRDSKLSPGGYLRWVVEVPYRIHLEGKKSGTLDAIMTMDVRRVSLTWREDGIWVERYHIKAGRGGSQ